MLRDNFMALHLKNLVMIFFCCSISTGYTKTTVHIGVHVPIVQQTTLQHHIQYRSPATQTTSIYSTQPSISKTQTVPKEFNRFQKPQSVYYRPEYRTDVVRTLPSTVVYTTPVVVHSLPESQVNVQTVNQVINGDLHQITTVQRYHSVQPLQISAHFQLGDVIPYSYRQVNYWVNDWQAYQLSAPRTGQIWLNIHGQFLLVNQPDYTIIQIH